MLVLLKIDKFILQFLNSDVCKLHWLSFFFFMNRANDDSNVQIQIQFADVMTVYRCSKLLQDNEILFLALM